MCSLAFCALLYCCLGPYLDVIYACALECRDISACASHCRDMSACASHSRDIPECGPHIDFCVPLHTAAAYGSLRAMDVVRLRCHMYTVVEPTAVSYSFAHGCVQGQFHRSSVLLLYVTFCVPARTCGEIVQRCFIDNFYFTDCCCRIAPAPSFPHHACIEIDVHGSNRCPLLGFSQQGKCQSTDSNSTLASEDHCQREFS